MSDRAVIHPPEFPQQMLEAGARQLIGHYDQLPPDIKALWQHKAGDVLRAALDGYAAVPVPHPDDVDAEKTAYWGDVFTGSFVSSRPPSGDPCDNLHGVDLGWLFRVVKQSPERAEDLAGWLVAGAVHARPQPEARHH